MPELPELWVIRERLEEALLGKRAVGAPFFDPFALRTVDPPLAALEGRSLTAVDRRSKYLLLEFDESIVVALHLMLGGRLHLKDAAKFKPHRKRTVLAIPFDDGPVLEMTEAGTKRRASVHVLHDARELAKIDRGIEPFDETLTVERLGALLRSRNHQLKTALRAPDLLSGIGNAYSDEILFAARLSPVRLTSRLTDDEIARLHHSIRTTLTEWIDRVRTGCPDGLPTKQDTWRRETAVHGKAGRPCPVCGGIVARIASKDSETNYCPACQNDGNLLADRRLSRFGIRRPPRPV
jgi:formamidopyrimidine-DNA glycosylase